MRRPTLTPTDAAGEFILTVPHINFEDSETVESDVVGLVTIAHKISIGYSHHLFRQRPANAGPATSESMVRLTLSPGISAVLLQGFETAFMRYADIHVEDLPDV